MLVTPQYYKQKDSHHGGFVDYRRHKSTQIDDFDDNERKLTILTIIDDFDHLQNGPK